MLVRKSSGILAGMHLASLHGGLNAGLNDVLEGGLNAGMNDVRECGMHAWLRDSCRDGHHDGWRAGLDLLRNGCAIYRGAGI